METEPLPALRKSLVELLRRSRDAHEHERTAVLREIAATLFDVRTHFETPDGQPDYKGHSFAYRTWVGDAWADAQLSRDEAASILSAARYHVGAVLRDRLDDKALSALGLMPQTPKERTGERRRAREAAILAQLAEKEVSGGALNGLAAAQILLSRIEAADLDELEGPNRLAAGEALAGIERKSRSLRRKLNAG